MARVEVKERTCDGCGKVDLRHHEDEMPGLSGTVIEISPWGGNNATWDACSRDCVGAAVAAAMDRAWAS